MATWVLAWKSSTIRIIFWALAFSFCVYWFGCFILEIWYEAQLSNHHGSCVRCDKITWDYAERQRALLVQVSSISSQWSIHISSRLLNKLRLYRVIWTICFRSVGKDLRWQATCTQTSLALFCWLLGQAYMPFSRWIFLYKVLWAWESKTCVQHLQQADWGVRGSHSKRIISFMIYSALFLQYFSI